MVLQILLVDEVSDQSLHDNTVKWECFPHHCEGDLPVMSWFCSQKTRNVELWCFLWCKPENTAEQTLEILLIWDDMMLVWNFCNAFCRKWLVYTIICLTFINQTYRYLYSLQKMLPLFECKMLKMSYIQNIWFLFSALWSYYMIEIVNMHAGMFVKSENVNKMISYL